MGSHSGTAALGVRARIGGPSARSEPEEPEIQPRDRAVEAIAVTGCGRPGASYRSIDPLITRNGFLEVARDPLLPSRDPGSVCRPSAITWLAFSLFVMYGSTIPFNFTSDRAVIFSNLSRIRLNPFVSPETGRRVSMPDIAQNFLLFAPFGLLGDLALRSSTRSPGRRLAIVIVSATLLGAIAEASQLFTVDRTASVSDLAGNVFGASGGFMAAHGFTSAWRRTRLQAWTRGLVDVPAFYPMMVATLLVGAAAWEPFDFTLDVSTLMGKIHALRADLWQFAGINDEGVELFRYSLFGLSLTLWLRQLGVRAPSASAAIVGASAAVGLEAGQWLVQSRMPGAADALVHTAGALAGMILARIRPRGRSPAFWCAAVAFATLAGAAIQLLNPAPICGEYRSFGWSTLLGYYERTPFETLNHVIETMLIYVPVGFSLAFVIQRGARLWIAALGVAMAIAIPLAFAQAWVVGRFPEATDVGTGILGSVCGAWLGGPAWAVFAERVAHLRSTDPRTESRTSRRRGTAGLPNDPPVTVYDSASSR